MTDLPPLREVLDAHGLSADKRFGQHFLLDLNVTRKIARLAGPFDGDVVIEVGPGPGGLTRALLETDASAVIAVEKDRRFIPLLQELGAASEDRLTVIEADALKVDELDLLEGRTGHLVSNLPYNVGTPLLIKWLTGPWRPRSLTLMFQLEVAERIVARPGTGAYGRLAVLAQWRSTARIAMKVHRSAFVPPPKVMSAVVHIVAAAQPEEVRAATLERLTAAAFGQRRKMLRRSLAGLPGAVAALEALGIDPERRAETLAVADFVAVARTL